MDVTRLAGVALAWALMFSCAGRAAPDTAAAISDSDELPLRPAVHEARPEDGGETRI